MRRRLLLLLLPLFLLLAQQGAVWHELSHYRFDGSGSESTQSASAKQGQAADRICDDCLAFASLAGVAAPQAFLLDLLSFNHGAPSAPAFHAAAIDAPSPRSRGPPRFL